MKGSAINHEAVEFFRKLEIMILNWNQKHRGQNPQYLFLSVDALKLLTQSGHGYKTFMGIDIAPVGVSGVYAGIGEWFI